MTNEKIFESIRDFGLAVGKEKSDKSAPQIRESGSQGSRGRSGAITTGYFWIKKEDFLEWEKLTWAYWDCQRNNRTYRFSDPLRSLLIFQNQALKIKLSK